jgi:hypothetical protein
LIFSCMCMLCRSLFVLLSFIFCHYVVCPSSIYGFWLPPFGIFKLLFLYDAILDRRRYTERCAGIKYFVLKLHISKCVRSVYMYNSYRLQQNKQTWNYIIQSTCWFHWWLACILSRPSWGTWTKVYLCVSWYGNEEYK